MFKRTVIIILFLITLTNIENAYAEDFPFNDKIEIPYTLNGELFRQMRQMLGTPIDEIRRCNSFKCKIIDHISIFYDPSSSTSGELIFYKGGEKIAYISYDKFYRLTFVEGEAVFYITDDKNLTFKETDSLHHNMKYADKSDLSKHLKNIITSEDGNDKIFANIEGGKSELAAYLYSDFQKTDPFHELKSIGGSNIFDYSDYIDRLPSKIVGKEDFSFKKILKQYSSNSYYECYDNPLRFGYSTTCDKIRKKSHQRYSIPTYCANEANAVYMACVAKMEHMEGLAKMQYFQNCQQQAQNIKQSCATSYTETEEVCEKPNRFVVSNHLGKEVFIIPLDYKLPDLKGIPYPRVVKALYEKYGAATFSQSLLDSQRRRIEAFYWVDKPWVLMVKVIVKHKRSDIQEAVLDRMSDAERDKAYEVTHKCWELAGNEYDKCRANFAESPIVKYASSYSSENDISIDIDEAEVENMLVMYINTEAYNEQIKYVEEEKRKEEAAKQAEIDRKQKEKEDRIKNFEL